MTEPARILTPPPINLTYVFGPPRSGTTLLASALSHGPAHPYLPECTIITDLIRERIRLESDIEPNKFRAFLHDFDHADHIFSSSIEFILRGIVDHSAETYQHLVLKDPHLIFFVDDVDRLIKWSNKKICIIRDPRDAVSSYMEVMRRDGLIPDLQKSIIFLKPFFEAALALYLSPIRPVIVRYEDLVSFDAFVISELQNFFGYDLDLGSYTGVPKEALHLDSPWYTSTYEGPVITTRVGSHHSLLTADQIRCVEDNFADFLLTFYAN
ncbi:MAG: hypothetical protein EON58_13770 [Alphaproteobacteria bacterium]|nr:MAG: hypothetical protein EON58_13770 [Alphaproteobacteria bacterium]